MERGIKNRGGGKKARRKRHEERKRDSEKDRETRKREPIVTRTLKFNFLIHSHPFIPSAAHEPWG